MLARDAASGGPNYRIIDSQDALAAILPGIHAADRVGLDTEADSLHHYFEKVCLIQISFSGSQYIVDPLAGFSLEPLWPVIQNKPLIFHAADYDLRMLKKTFGFQPSAPVFDTMLAAQMLGYEKFGLGALVEKICGVLLPKQGQKADWSRRPLTPELLQYASDDTRFLEYLACHLTQELDAAGRLRWHRESCARVVRNALQDEKEQQREAWRIKGSSKMLPVEMVFLKELWHWRDDEARRRDRPVFMILHNEDLIELTYWCAHRLRDPNRTAPIFLKRISGEKGERLQAAIQRAEQTPPKDYPRALPKSPKPEVFPSAEKIDALMAYCRELAADLKLEPSVIASRAALTRAVQHRPQSLETAVELCGFMPWQAELLMPALRKIVGA